jgi:hypothetical protein
MSKQSGPYWGGPRLFRPVFLIVGAAILGVMGYLFGGPVGAMIGACIGFIIALSKLE